MTGAPLLSVVLCTWNRAALLAGALEALLAQDATPPHEILVVDNGSRDATPEVIARARERSPHVRGLVEPRQGLSYARNTGVAAAGGRIVAFTDDDVRVGPRWVQQIADAFAANPDAACVGGPVKPQWTGPVPDWLSVRHWAPLGIQDYGAERLRVDATRPLCLIGANVAFRRDALDRVGAFDPRLQRVRERGGTTEDHDLHVRLWEAGLHGIYDPALAVTAVVLPERLRKRHHRAWHYGHGRHVARMRLREIEAARWRLFGIPAHLIRQCAADAIDWARALLRGNTAAAFDREVNLWFAAGFLRERCQ